MTRAEHKARRTVGRIANLFQRFRREEDGATAVEFALVAIPFFTIIFGIVELALVFFVSSAMTHAVSEAGRQIRTGNFQACGSQQQFKDMICRGMDGMGNCANTLRIDVVSEPTFSAVSLPEPQPPAAPGAGQPPVVPNGEFDNTVAGAPVVIRATMYYPLALPAELTRLETVKGSNTRILVATTAFRNEPFPTPGACPAT